MKVSLARFRKMNSDQVFARVGRTAVPFVLTAGPALIIAPHPDDETLGCGGLIALKRDRGAAVRIVFLTAGERGPGATANQPLTQTRRAEAAAALAHLQVLPDDCFFWDYPDAGLAMLSAAEQVSLAKRLAAVIEECQIEEIFVTHRADCHRDHEAAFRAACGAMDLLPAGRQVALWQYPIWFAWLKPLRSRLHAAHLAGAHCLDMSAALERKKEALAAYASQVAAFPAGFVERFEMPVEIFFATGGH